MPTLNFDLRRRFSELEGLTLEPGLNSKIKDKLVVAKVEQLVRFQLDENGAVLKSEAVIALPAGMPMPGRFLIFDQPFLILMKQKDARMPYFALWVGNASLLVPASKKRAATPPKTPSHAPSPRAQFSRALPLAGRGWPAYAPRLSPQRGEKASFRAFD